MVLLPVTVQAPLFFACFVATNAVLTPIQMQQKMGIGINLGNTLEAPVEGSWAPAAKASFFDEYKKIGFTNVRVPVRWDNHTQKVPPYAIDPTFMNRVEAVLDWSLSRGFVTVVNSHHDDWLDTADEAEFKKLLPRFTAIWTQVASCFKDKNETLLFEIFNEPHVMSEASLNEMNKAILPVIRSTNPTRIVLFGGLQWMSPSWMVSNPDAMDIPSGDKQLMLEVHNYDPYFYAQKIPPTVHSWGSAADIAALHGWIGAIKNWSTVKGLPIFYGEFGCTHHQTVATGRDVWYNEHFKAITAAGFAAAVWDDDGLFKVFDRNADTWDNGVLTALGKHPIGPATPTPSPTPAPPTPPTPPTPPPTPSDVKPCPGCAGGACGCSWATPAACTGPGDGSCCHKCCCGHVLSEFH
jgi:endoglucanase